MAGEERTGTLLASPERCLVLPAGLALDQESGREADDSGEQPRQTQRGAAADPKLAQVDPVEQGKRALVQTRGRSRSNSSFQSASGAKQSIGA